MTGEKPYRVVLSIRSVKVQPPLRQSRDAMNDQDFLAACASEVPDCTDWSVKGVCEQLSSEVPLRNAATTQGDPGALLPSRLGSPRL